MSVSVFFLLLSLATAEEFRYDVVEFRDNSGIIIGGIKQPFNRVSFEVEYGDQAEWFWNHAELAQDPSHTQPLSTSQLEVLLAEQNRLRIHAHDEPKFDEQEPAKKDDVSPEEDEGDGEVDRESEFQISRKLSDCGPELEEWKGKGFLYEGCQTKTTDGWPCQHWADNSPQDHKFTSPVYADELHGHNYCRSPDDKIATYIWCWRQMLNQTF